MPLRPSIGAPEYYGIPDQKREAGGLYSLPSTGTSGRWNAAGSLREPSPLLLIDYLFVGRDSCSRNLRARRNILGILHGGIHEMRLLDMVTVVTAAGSFRRIGLQCKIVLYHLTDKGFEGRRRRPT
jgi:hypothetical protein